jgi:hypothetical protein
MAQPEVTQAWNAYKAAIGKLYETEPAAIIENAQNVAVDMGQRPEDEQIDDALAKSDALMEVLKKELESNDPVKKNHAATQLLAASVVDLSVSDDLAPHEDAVMSLTVEVPSLNKPSLTKSLGPMDAILSNGPGEDIRIAEDPGPAIRGGSPDSDDPKVALKAEMEKALDSIRDDAGTGVSKAFGGFKDLGPQAVLDAMGEAAMDVLKVLGDKARHGFHRLARFAINGIKKILEIFGQDADKLEKKVLDWAKKLDEKGLQDLVGKLYGIDKIKKDLGEEIENAPASANGTMTQATKELEELADGFDHEIKVIGWVIWVVDKVQGWLMHLVEPWGAAGLALAYGATTGYVVFAGGDRVDWRNEENKGILEIVPGVQNITHNGITEKSNGGS